MKHKPCPECGEEKHYLMACKHCGFIINKKYHSTNRSSPSSSENAQNPDFKKAELVQNKKIKKPVEKNPIKEYIDRNPFDEGMGKFGVPQDKYRHGSFGARSIEYDSWRKETKK